MFSRGKRTAILENKFRHENTADEKRKEHQKELMHKMNEEALRRIKEGGDKKETVRKKKAPVSYQKGSYLPRAKEVQSLQVWGHGKAIQLISPKKCVHGIGGFMSILCIR